MKQKGMSIIIFVFLSTNLYSEEHKGTDLKYVPRLQENQREISSDEEPVLECNEDGCVITYKKPKRTFKEIRNTTLGQ